MLSLPNFRLPRSWTLSLSAAARRTTPAAGADSVLVENDGARAVGVTAVAQLPGRRSIAALLRAAAGGPSALSSLNIVVSKCS